MNNRLLCVWAMLAMLSLPLSMGAAKAAEVIGSTTDGYLGASSTKITLKNGGSIHYEFSQQTAAEEFWHGFVLMVENAYGGSPLVALRCDNWENVAWSNEGCTSDFNWDTFVSMMNGASIDMDINYENGTLSMSSTISGSDGNTYNYSYSKTLSDEFSVVVVYLSEDHAQLTINTTEVKNQI